MGKNFRLLGLVLAASILFSGCSSSAEGSETRGQNGAMQAGMGGAMAQANLTSVETVVLEKTGITNTLTYTGSIDYSDSYSVTPEISGKVEVVNYNVGDRVEAGDVLFTISDKDIRDNITSLEASLATSNASITSQQTNLAQLEGSSKTTQLMNLETSISNAQASLESAKISQANAEVSITQAETNMNTVKNTYDQTKALFDIGGASQTELDNTRRAYDTAVDTYNTAQRSYEQSKISLSQAEKALANAEKSYDVYLNQTLPENKQSAQNSLNSATASRNSILIQLEQAKRQLEDTTVASPISGVISAKNISAGQSVSSSTVAYTIISTDKVYIEANVTEQLITAISIGDPVSVLVSAVNSEPFAGRIISISPITDSTGTYPVEVVIDNTDGNIKIGMFAEVSFVKEQNSQALIVTNDAVLTDENGSYVFIVENGASKRVDVTTGIGNGSEIELTSGVSVNDEVIVKGQSSVTDGELVNIISASK